MGGEQGQATVEHVGIVLAVALLLGALAGAIGSHSAAGELARAVSEAIGRALGVGSGSTRLTQPRSGGPEPTAAEVARLLRALDPTIPIDARPTLRDLRIDLAARLGTAQGEALFQRLVAAEVGTLLPQAREEREYRGFWGRPPNGATFLPPARARPIDSERPTGPLDVHVVGAQES